MGNKSNAEQPTTLQRKDGQGSKSPKTNAVEHTETTKASMSAKRRVFSGSLADLPPSKRRSELEKNLEDAQIDPLLLNMSEFQAPQGLQTDASGPQLSPQHQRLLFEPLGLKSFSQFQRWLNGPSVGGAWDEFVRDYLTDHPRAPEPDKLKVSQSANNTIRNRTAKYLIYYPPKNGWATEDHYIRFIAMVVQDSMLGKLWSETSFKKRGFEICKAVYEVLSYLRATKFPVKEAKA